MKKQYEYYMATDKGGNKINMEYKFFLVDENEEPHRLAMPSGAVFENGEQIQSRKESLRGK